MSGKQQGLRYFQKFLNSKASERNALAKKVLRCVLAVGFALSPWLGGEAYAGTAEAPGIVRMDGTGLTDTKFLDGTSNVAHIYAEQASGDVGLNRFKTFEVGAGQIANLYFKTSPTDTNHLNTLVNTVQEQISISGIVNGIRNNEIGGNLYFLSPKGMVVGSSGVINAGALTVITTGVDNITTPAKAISTINSAYSNSSSLALTEHPIEIHGQINTVNGIDLRSLSIAISKGSDSDIKPYLKTGVVFEKIVNTNELNELVGEVKLKSERSSLTDTKIELYAYKAYWDGSDTVGQLGTITLNGCDFDSIGDIEIDAGNSFNINSVNLKSKNAIKMDFAHSRGGSDFYGDLKLNSGKIEADGLVDIRVGKTITIGNNADIISNITKDETTSKVTLMTSVGDITNNGTISTKTSLDIQAGVNGGSDDASITNSGTIKATGGGMSFTVDKSLTNNGLIQADDQILFTVGGTLTNNGKIESTSSNVQAHIGRNFKNIPVHASANSSTLTGGIIEAGGNVQIDYNRDNEGIGVASSEEAIDGIYNSGLIWAKGDKDPVKKPDGTVDANSGSGNIWLRSSYNIENTATGQMIAGRQITLNARDFLHNYGLIEGVTYLDIKSIMGYVYNHKDATIKATGGNIDLSSGQANLQIDGDTNGQKKEEYRKFTPIIIEGKVEATSALNNTTSETNQGNINIRAYLGDIYVDGGTIKAKAGPNGEVKAVAGNVILDAAQNITIGFETVKAWADDPTTDNKDGYHPEYVSDTEREYYKLLKDTSGNLVSGNAAQISSTNITLTSGSRATNTISISAVNNALTASDAVNFETAEMDFAGGTITANKISASGQLNVTGGSLSSTSGGSLTISGAEGLTLGAGAGISTDKDLTITSEKGSILNNAVLMANNGSLTMSGAGSVNAGTVTGKDVVLSSGGGSGITADKIIVDTSLQLQGNDIAVTEIDRSNNTDVLKVDVFGAGGASSAVKGDLQLNIAGNVLFNTMNVTNADITVGGALGVDKLHVEGEAHFNSNEQKIGVFGDAKAPVDDDSDAMYRDLGDGNNSWMSITMDSEGYEIKNGSEINNIFGDSTVDPVEMSTKLLDFNPHETFVETFGTSVNIFSRMDLIEAPERPAGDIAPVPQGGKTVLKHDANGLHIEEEKEEKR